MQQVRMGVIGVGYLGEHHARIYSDLEGVTLAAVSDIDEEKSMKMGKKYNCKTYTRYLDLLDECDAVSIVTPTTTHYKVAMDIIAAGKDLLIEKPITENLEEAKQIVKEAASHNCVLQIGHLERFNPAIIAASGLVNNPKFIESERLSPFLGRGTDVDVTLDLMIHDIDVVLSLVSSRIIDIRAIGESILSEKLDVAKVWLEFENGCKGLITASRLSSEKSRKLKIHQKDSFMIVDYQKQELKRYVKKSGSLSFDSLTPEPKEPLREELEDFIRCIRSREVPRVSGTDGVNALEVALRISALLRENAQSQ